MRQYKSFERSVPRLLTAAAVSLLLSACGGGGDGDSSVGGLDVPGLDIPSQVSLIEAKDTGGSSDGLAGDGMSGDATTDYATDEAQSYVYDPSMDALQTVNQILCLVAQTAASERVNAGPYIALIDDSQCDSDSAGTQTSSAGGASSSTPDYAQWVVDVTRANATAPQIAKFWVPSDGDGTDPLDNQTVLVELTVTAAPSAALPNGEFVLNFKGALDGADVGLPGSEIALMRGTLKTVATTGSGTQLSFFNESGDSLPGLASLSLGGHQIERVNVISGAAGADTGQAVTSIVNTDTSGSTNVTQSSLYAVDFNATGLQRGHDVNDNSQIEVGELACLSRDDFDTYGWRYNLYHAATGARVELNSGFSFSQVNNIASMGYVGEWGIWTEDGTGLSHGDQISRESDSGSTPDTYTVALSEGKLTKRSLGTVSFTDLIGAQLEWWGDASDPYCASSCTNSVQNVVSVDGLGVVSVTHSWDDSGSDPVLVEIVTPVIITPTNAGETLNLWSNALGGSVTYQQGSSTLTAYSQETLRPDAVELSSALSLVCYSQCPEGGLFSPAAGVDLYYDETDGSAGGRFTYTLTSASGSYTLVDDLSGLVVALRSVDNLGVGAENTGIYTGPMVPVTDDPGVLLSWQIYDAPVSYNWQSGPQDWNMNTSVLDASNAVVVFDQPLQFFYNYSAGDDVNIDPVLTNHPAGNAYQLSYAGDGDLWGFPYSPDANCNGNNCPYYPSVTLTDGVLLGANDEYMVRLTESEQHMQEDAAACTALDAVAVLANPALALPTAVDADVPFSISDKPDLTGVAPAVIEGVVQ